MLKQTFLFNERGFSIYELSLTATLTGIAILAGTAMSKGILTWRDRIDDSTIAIEMVTNMNRNIQGNVSWKNTIEDSSNTTFDCIRQKTDCSASGGTFRLKDHFNNVFYDPQLTAESGSLLSGFGSTGLCTAFDPANGNIKCPFRYELTWTPVCPPSPAICINPSIKVQGLFLVKYPEQHENVKSINASNYHIDINKKSLREDLNEEYYYVSFGTLYGLNNRIFSLPKYAGTKPLQKVRIMVNLTQITRPGVRGGGGCYPALLEASTTVNLGMNSALPGFTYTDQKTFTSSVTSYDCLWAYAVIPPYKNVYIKEYDSSIDSSTTMSNLIGTGNFDVNFTDSASMSFTAYGGNTFVQSSHYYTGFMNVTYVTSTLH